MIKIGDKIWIGEVLEIKTTSKETLYGFATKQKLIHFMSITQIKMKCKRDLEQSIATRDNERDNIAALKYTLNILKNETAQK